MGGKSSSSSESGPWVGTQPYLKDVYGQAQSIYNKGAPGYYPGQTWTDFNPVQQDSMDATLARSGGSPSESAMGMMLTDTLSGPGVSMDGAERTANSALSGFNWGKGTVQKQTDGINHRTATQRSGNGTSPYANMLASKGNYNGAPTAKRAPGGALSALTRNSTPTSLAQTNQHAGGTTPLNVGAKSRLATLAEGNNPYLENMAKSATDSVRKNFTETVMPGINATFGMGGRTGSKAHQAALDSASDTLSGTLSDMTSDIYGSNYQSDMDRSLAAASTLGGLEIDEFGANSTDDLARKGLSADLYLGNKSLSNDAAGTLMNDDVNRTSLAQDYDLNRRSLSQGAIESGYGFQLDKNRMTNDLVERGADRALSAGGMLMDTGMGAIDDMTQMYTADGNMKLGAGSLVDDMSSLEWGNIDRMRGVGDDVQGLSESMLEDDIERFNYYQNAPMDILNWYAGVIGDNAMMSNRGKNSGWNIQF